MKQKEKKKYNRIAYTERERWFACGNVEKLKQNNESFVQELSEQIVSCWWGSNAFSLAFNKQPTTSSGNNPGDFSCFLSSQRQSEVSRSLSLSISQSFLSITGMIEKSTYHTRTKAKWPYLRSLNSCCAKIDRPKRFTSLSLAMFSQHGREQQKPTTTRTTTI